MIHGVFGKLGSGKGLYVMQIMCEELITGNRDIVTNVPLRQLPWVNGQGQPQIGFVSYLASKGLENFDWGRVHVIEDMDNGFDLFMWRRDGETHEWFKMTADHPDDKGRDSRFDPGEALKRHCQPVLIVTDEAWAFYPNNGGWSRSPLLPFYGRQSRKLRDEWYIVTQHPTDVDSVVWNIAQDFTVCRNHGMERMGIFRQPSMFRTITYLTNPVKGNAVRSHEAYHRLDAKGLAQCYDTTAGVGFTGGFKGDAGGKRKGLHIGWLLVAVLVGVVFLAFVPTIMGRAASMFFGHALPKPKNVNSNSGTSDRQGGSPGPSLNLGGMAQNLASPVNHVSDPATNIEVWCIGYCFVDRQPIVFLSDGSTVMADSGRIQTVAKGYVVVDGHRYIVKTASAVLYDEVRDGVKSEQPRANYGSVVRPSRDSQVLGSVSGISPSPSVRLNGFGKLRDNVNQR
jgi:hypothetical protein